MEKAWQRSYDVCLSSYVTMRWGEIVLFFVSFLQVKVKVGKPFLEPDVTAPDSCSDYLQVTEQWESCLWSQRGDVARAFASIPEVSYANKGSCLHKLRNNSSCKEVYIFMPITGFPLGHQGKSSPWVMEKKVSCNSFEAVRAAMEPSRTRAVCG